MYKSAMWPSSELAKTPIGVPQILKVKCDSNCPRYNSEGFCEHTIAVALKNKTMESFASASSKCNEKTTRVASQKIKSNVFGHKAPVRIRKPPLGSPEKFSSSAFTNTAIKISGISNTTAAYDPPKMNDVRIITSFPSSFLNHLSKDIKSDLVLTLLFLCDKRVSVCYGCGNSFRYNENDPQQPFDLVLVTKLRRI